MRKMRRSLCILLSAVFLLGCFQGTFIAEETPVAAEAVLENIAPQAVITSSANDTAQHVKWVDGSAAGVGIINHAVMTAPVFAQFDLGGNAKIESVEITFEKYDPDPNNFVFHYNLYGQKFNDTAWETIVADATATRLTDGYIKTHALPPDTEYAVIKLEMTAIDKTGGNPHPAMNEFKIFEAAQSTENIAPLAMVTSTANDAGEQAKWVDGSYAAYGLINRAVMTDPVFAQFDFDSDVRMESVEITFEKVTTDPYALVFHYNLSGKKLGATEWETFVTDATATRLDNVRSHALPADTAYAAIRMDLTDIERVAPGTPWPAMTEFKIFGERPPVTNPDPENIAFGAPVHTRISGAASALLTDGKTAANAWSAAYPAYADIDLGANYNLSAVEVFTPQNGYSRYAIFTSMDGRDFDLLDEKDSTASCAAEGDIFAVDGTEARFVRVYVTYQSTDANARLNEIKVRGTASGTPTQSAPPVQVEDYEDSEYNVAVTDADAIEEVQGIIARNIGEDYIGWFDFAIAPNTVDPAYDYYEIADADGKILITGNNGVSLATGLNHYLKYFCNVHISQVGNQVRMPETAPAVGATVRKSTQFQLRYAYNYCTHSYTMPFWGEDEWRKELDWLALNGVSLVLDITGQEEVWRRFLGELNYTHEEVKDFLVGPAYYAWSYMQNITSFAGPLHDSWFAERTELARKNQLIMRKLGMQPILQGYSGMVPVDIVAHDPELNADSVIDQSEWGRFVRPFMLRTDQQAYRDYAALFYETQKDVFGDIAQYFATDPFHEGGRTGGMSQAVVSENVAQSLVSFKEDGVWVIQSWDGNPGNVYMSGLADYKDNILVLDLNADRQPRWENTTSYGGKEFGGSPWIWCMLNNFGGRVGLYGHISNIVEGVAQAANQAEHMKGIGITPEASMTNPLLYDLFFETIWADDPDNIEEIDIEEWLRDYAERRYGAASDAAYEAMTGFLATVYDSEHNSHTSIGAGAPESVVNATPDLNITKASQPGNAIVYYDKTQFEEAVRSLLSDYDTLKASDAYLYDVAETLKQLLANTAQEYQKAMANAFNAGDLERFNTESERFLAVIDLIERVLGTREEFMVGPWIQKAKDLARDDFSEMLYEFNARALNTTWGVSYNTSLKDYANRQWAGLTKDYYKLRWETWIQERQKQLAGDDWASISWFPIEWNWAISRNAYATEASGEDLKALADIVFANYTLDSIEKLPEEDDAKDIPLEGMTFEAGSNQNGEDITKAFDNNVNTMWHTNWNGAPRANHYAVIHLNEPKTVDGLRYLPRQAGTNGIVTAYEIQVSRDGGATYETVADGEWARNSAWKLASFEPQEGVTDVKFVSVASASDGANLFTSAAEIRLTEPVVNITPNAEITSTGNNAEGAHAKWYDGQVGMGSAVVGLIKNGAQTDPDNPAFAQFAFTGDADIRGIEITFEEVGATDAAAFRFTYNLLGQKAGQTDWDIIAANQQATRITGDNVRAYAVNEKYSIIKMEVLKVDNAASNQWRYPAMTEFKIFGTLPSEPADPDPSNIAAGKAVHAHSGHATAANAADNNPFSLWTGGEYPAYIDIDLGANYNLDQVEVFTPVAANTQYTVYTSMDGKDYDFLAEKDSDARGAAEGDVYAAAGKEARIVRVYVEYHSASALAVVNEIKVRGEASGSAVQTAPPINIEPYETSEYNGAITEQDTVSEVQGIVERQFGAEYVDWFDFVLAEPGANGYDFFEITQRNGKIQISGNNGVSLATGLNHYLKYYCNVHISQVGNQTDMPDEIVPVDGTVRKETAFPVRYSYNYCTFSYTMAFWGEEEWRNELDWLALNGVNLVLDLTAQEEVWRRFMAEIGYDHQDIKDFIVGPAYYGWAYMSNMYSFGGPVHDNWFADRTELARKNQLIMRKLGMSPVLQGYCGMVPVDIADYDDTVDPENVIDQGYWCGTKRPSMLRTDSDTFVKYAELFYQAQAEVFGADATDYYATDPFHEGGIRDGLDEAYIAKTVMEKMLDFDDEAVWVIQSWTSNPTTALLNGLADYRDNTLILDLHAEKDSRSEWDQLEHGGSREFAGSPWVFCMLNNFGGRSGLRGSTDYWVEEIATLQQRTDHLKGIGIVPEGSHNNPFLYDLFFEVIWSETPDDMTPTDMDEWIKNYTTRRYGAESASAAEAWGIINAVAYKEDAYATDQASESIFNARPSLNVTKASPYGSTAINIDTVAFRHALDLLLTDYNTLKASDAYLYDVADVLEQSLTHSALAIYNEMRAAYNAKDLAAFDEAAQAFLAMADKVEDVLGTRKEFLLGGWLDGARKISANMDDFSQKVFDMNGRALLTTWGADNISDHLYDYTNRQWAGLTQDYYMSRWNAWIDQARANLESGGTSLPSGNAWFPLEWQWVIGHIGEGDNADGTYTTEPNGLDLLTLVYDDAATSVTIAQADGVVTADYIIRNDADEPMNVLLIVAAYDAAGRLTDMIQEVRSVDGKGITNASVTMPFDAAAAKAFLWDADTFAPLFEATGIVNRITANATATASSYESGRDPYYAIDGNAGTRWASPNSDGADAWLTVDLGAEYDISEVILTWENAYATQYNIAVATEEDPENFTTVAQKTDGGGGTETVSFDPVKARYVKFQGVERFNAGWGYSIWEFEIHGAKAA